MNPPNSSAASGGERPFPFRTAGDDLFPWPWMKYGMPHLLPNFVGGDLVPWPWANAGTTTLAQDGGNHPVAPAGYSEVRGRSSYRATRLGTTLMITAEGDLSNLNQFADIRQLPLRIHPPQFGMFVYTPKIVLPALRHFQFTETFGFPVDVSQLTMHDADGLHSVPIEDFREAALPLDGGQMHAEIATPVATGLGKSLQEALDHAVAQLPSSNSAIPDGFVVYTITASGRFRGGFPGLDQYFAKVRATFGTAGP